MYKEKRGVKLTFLPLMLALSVALSACTGSIPHSMAASKAIDVSVSQQPASGITGNSQAGVSGGSAQSKAESDAPAADYEVRGGIHTETFATPPDLPPAYDYGSGKFTDFARDDMNRKLPEPTGNQTVLNTAPDLANIQALYLWEENNVPAKTNFTADMAGYFDEYDFRPYVTAIPVRKGIKAKGAVVLMAGGAYQFRGNYTDTLPTAIHLRELGFQTFIVDYRLSPYTPQEGALDVARAVRFVRKNADRYGIKPDNIAVMGYSAGGIQAGEFLMHYDEMVNGMALDPNYIPDELDSVPARASADAMIYSFYGRLSHGSLDVEALRAGKLPPTFYCYGTEDPFYTQFEAQVEVMKQVGIDTKTIVLQDWPHGFGADGGWVEDYARWLEGVFDGSEETAQVTKDTSVLEIIQNPAFDGFGQYLFPTERGIPNASMKLDNIGSLMPYHNNINADTSARVVNYLLDEVADGETVFYEIYSDAEKAADPTKKDTGLFFFRGEKNAPFAIVNAGGGFSYVGSMHESFPHALELSRKGYNAFALQYRTGGAEIACEDLATAISFVFANADSLGVDTDCYSLWGGSAGARMAAYLGSYGPANFGGDNLPRAGAVIMQYTGHSDTAQNEPPTYVCVGENDGIANWRSMESRTNQLKSLGVDTEFHLYPNLGHGFGLGIGTSAEGWLDDAVAFWEKQKKE